jgi:carbon monoxide dehydrogenase subunit G
MKMTGEEIIAAPRQVVWDALNDPDVLKQCITGCEEIKKKSDTELEAKVTAKVGPVKASFVGAVKLSKLNPPRSYVISGEGKGGVAGFAKGGATVQLSDTAEGHTKLSYDVDAQVGGKLAQIGSRLIDSTAKKMATDFFKKFNKVVSELAQGAGTEGKSKPAAKKTRRQTKKSAAKKTAAKASATKTAAAASAARPAAKKTAKKPASKASAAGGVAKKAAKKAQKTTAAASSAAKASVKSAKTSAKSAGGSVKAAAKTASKTASKAAKKASSKASSAASSAVSAAEGAAAEARQASVQTAATATNAAKTAAASASQGADKVANSMPPQAKSMSTMWMLVMAAAAIGLLLIWASGKG